MSKLEAATKEKVFTFPVALDADWAALKRWWLNQERDWTSVSFLLDRQGIIRYVHPGGEFHDGTEGGLDRHESCQRDLHVIEAKISQCWRRNSQSRRRATAGSVRPASRAVNQHGTAAVSASSKGAPRKLKGSSDPTPNNKLPHQSGGNCRGNDSIPARRIRGPSVTENELANLTMIGSQHHSHSNLFAPLQPQAYATTP